MKTNSTELKKAIDRIPETPGIFIAYFESRPPAGGQTDNLRATADYLASQDAELIQLVTTAGLTISLRPPN